ncbi:MAG TPA: hypothetical protein PLQ93_01920 [Bacteroidia bacterium]|nr:hypothetical protein [Bacteroidia bacterium]
MSRIVSLAIILVFAFSCIKKRSIGPVPKIEFLEFSKVGPAGYDSARIKLSYVDSDGDLFCDRSDQKPNLVMTTWAYNTDSAKYTFDLASSRVILQPADGYYKGKSIEGYIYLNESEFRSDAKPRIFRFEVQMTDTKGNASNKVVSDTYTLN